MASNTIALPAFRAERTEWILFGFSIALSALLLSLNVESDFAARAARRILLVFAIVVAEQFLPAYVQGSSTFRILRATGSFFLGFLLYQSVGYIIICAGLSLHDDWLIAADRWMLGGGDIASMMASVVPIRRPVVELLQYVYDLYYLLPLIVAVQLYRTRSSVDFEDFRSVILGVLCFCFVGYFLVPAVGPRFTLFEFSNLSTDLPGFWLTDWLRGWMNDGEGVMATMTSLEASRVVLRDAFPSGHTLISIMSAAAAYHYKLRNSWIVAVGALLVAFSTIYLRYHYLVDVMAAFAIGAGIYWWMRKKLAA